MDSIQDAPKESPTANTEELEHLSLPAEKSTDMDIQAPYVGLRTIVLLFVS